MPLLDLLTVVGLTPAQAALITADLLQAAGPTPPERVHAVLRDDGAVDISERDRGIRGVPLPELLEEVVRNARRLPAHPPQHQLRLLRQVEEQSASTGDAVARGTALRAALADVGGTHALSRTRRELVALVDAFHGHVAASLAVPTPRVNGHAVPLSPVVQPEVLRAQPQGRHRFGRRRARRRRVLALLAVLVVLVAAVGGYLLVRGPGSGLLDSLSGGSSPSGTHPSTPSAAPKQHPTGGATKHHGFRTLAATSAAPVRGVALQKTGTCGPGSACGVTVTVRLDPASVSRTVAWRVGVARACGKHVTWAPATTLTAQPGWSRVFASSTVQVPKGRSLALVALTTAPKRAASPPIPVGGSSLHC